jgi:hypothetical protein
MSILWNNVPESEMGFDLYDFNLVGEDPRFVQDGEFAMVFTDVEVGGEIRSMPDFIVTDPLYRLGADSPAVDAVSRQELLFGPPDIEGTARPCGDGFDIGAYERCDPAEKHFLRGDANADADVNIADGVRILQFLFTKGAEPPCLDAADANDDGTVDVADVLGVLEVLFVGAGRMPEPVDACGADPTADDIGCRDFAPCP